MRWRPVEGTLDSLEMEVVEGWQKETSHEPEKNETQDIEEKNGLWWRKFLALTGRSKSWMLTI